MDVIHFRIKFMPRSHTIVSLNETFKKLRFKFKPVFTLLCLFFFSLFCILGWWQIQRYHFKKTLLSHFQERFRSEPKSFPISSKSLDDLQFQPIKTEGYYQNDKNILIQNQFYQDQIGYEVLTPLQIPGQNKLLLIDRGWIAKTNANKIPIIEKISTLQHVTGYIKLTNEYQFILGKNILNPMVLPLVMQKIDFEQIAELTHKTFFPYIVRLSPKAQNGFIRDWIIATILPERHMAYAVQWFALALLLLIAYCCFCFEITSHEK